ncbi:MAG: [FeFe] hydrogenase H-cluster maturation GTPase HydF [Rikenellaceae bacterium]|nr:[FeFe] hydrogenase H-cluster maturation GTPase HydF [Rikenellaceae bacterium]
MKEERKIQPGRETKPHIGIYGRCNAGKSTLLNFITGADFALVSEQPGTTTDPVRKSYEILDFAPVVFIDTPGLDDRSALGEKRMRKSLETLAQIDLALLVFRQWGQPESDLVTLLQKEDIPYLLIYNAGAEQNSGAPLFPSLQINALHGDEKDREELLKAIRSALPEQSYRIPSLFEGKAGRGDFVLLVCPIDSEAPSGRIILPQVQAIRSLLDQHAVAVVVQPAQIESVFSIGIHPRLVVTDSQAFAQVKAAVPDGIEIISFSILLAQLKGDYQTYTQGLRQIDHLQEGSRILILENCLHQSSCEDIGRVKIPRLLQDYTGFSLQFTVISGLAALPENLADFQLAVQCGGCMVTRSQLQNRIRALRKAGVPVTNYGMLLHKLL